MPPLTMNNEHAQSQYAVTPSEIEVDYDKNITRLYQAICDSDWETAVAVAKSSPREAKTWVVRRDDAAEENPSGEAGIMWRFLPIHSACARQPPTDVVTALLKAYPDGARCVDDQGMYPLHYACGNQASREVIRLLLVNFPQAAKISDPQGMLPIHYLACWGPCPSSISVVDMVLVANRDVLNVQDVDGNTPLDLAMEGEYLERDEVVAVLTKWAEGKGEENEAPTQEVTSSKGRAKTPEMNRRSPSPATTGRDITPVEAVSVPSAYQTSDENANAGVLALSRHSYSNNVHQQYADAVDGDKTYNTKQVARLKAEIDKLKADKAFNEAQMEEKIESELTIYKDKISLLEKDLLESRGEASLLHGDLEAKNEKLEKLQATVEECEVEISTIKGEKLDMEHELKDQISSLEKDFLKSQDEASLLNGELEEKNEKLEKLQATIEECEVEISSLRGEKSDLEHQLGDMTEECKKYKAKSSHMNDRLGALSSSLTPMIEGQEVIMDSVKKQDEHVRNAAVVRQARLEEMLETERFMLKEMDMESGGAGELSNSYKELEKQKKEMDAISAVIAATRE